MVTVMKEEKEEDEESELVTCSYVDGIGKAHRCKFCLQRENSGADWGRSAQKMGA